MDTNNNLPCIFAADDENVRHSNADAPTFVLLLTAQILGALIAERVLRFDDDPMSVLNMTERTIAAAVDRAIAEVDLLELEQAHNARVEERHARQEAAHKAYIDNLPVNRARRESAAE